MSTTKDINVKLADRSNRYNVRVEQYNTAYEVAEDCGNREQVWKIYDMSDRSYSKDWDGVDSYDEALDLLRNGYQPVVDKLKTAIKADVKGNGKRISFQNNVYGFAPVVPLAIKGIPNCMVNMTMKPIKCKVIDVYYDIGVSYMIDAEQVTTAGQKFLASIIELEKQGYRFNLYALQAFSGNKDADVLCVKVKSSDKPIDLKRISFPLIHPAFLRVIGFDWQGKSPITRDRGSGRGRALTQNISDKQAKELAKQVFGDNAVYISCRSIVKHCEEKYIKEVLTK